MIILIISPNHFEYYVKILIKLEVLKHKAGLLPFA